MKQIRLVTLILVLICSLVLVVGGWTAGSLVVQRQVIGSAGQAATVDGIILDGTLGESIAGGISVGGIFDCSLAIGGPGLGMPTCR